MPRLVTVAVAVAVTVVPLVVVAASVVAAALVVNTPDAVVVAALVLVLTFWNTGARLLAKVTKTFGAVAVVRQGIPTALVARAAAETLA
jgi:hypothetical protein